MQPAADITAAFADQRVAAEVARYGSLDLAILALHNDACGAAWVAPVHDILRAALAERSARKAHAHAQRAA